MALHHDLADGSVTEAALNMWARKQGFNPKALKRTDALIPWYNRSISIILGMLIAGGAMLPTGWLHQFWSVLSVTSLITLVTFGFIANPFFSSRHYNALKRFRSDAFDLNSIIRCQLSFESEFLQKLMPDDDEELVADVTNFLRLTDGDICDYEEIVSDEKEPAQERKKAASNKRMSQRSFSESFELAKRFGIVEDQTEEEYIATIRSKPSPSENTPAT